ncbi:acetyl-CoA carboxylase biotin carboxyl carrier protein [Clostridium botulinum]|uniref:acetyl-CoA carboxylase biotin carboxyl carrier protein n=1 Tax=Clostridium botulinum TaxID=1491 RepID=UPI0007730135|nr:acetyl-CoA carboxylase biotin carboxyl carrier protein [Clostridium botulinum]MBN1070570.1 acetyl-CoA carboxylase biotin carboxyl carrier protein [Clostridium botulinum]NFE72894.1 acetyl-CoA carboxylase biotin carboxyl carrier protein [Clostridium botulinum]NFH78920.1 acetyl-CoA carboxylase biotin carboxyl carrier protein [Clostridium botulinum]NFH82830.1 acetyl-CoA carboxylase biotin carboxyl carrier protein [Clostridium botulinum]NFI10911.1 acetyl-CoA carboxylase biotin carboxyl carrier p
MDFQNIKELINIINSSDLAYFELKSNDGYVKMDKSLTRSLNRNVEEEETRKKESNIHTKEEPIQEKNNFPENKSSNMQEEAVEEDTVIITSPMVGTFYSSPSPESESFAKEGDYVKKGKVICIIEAMKLMNEIESNYNGKIVKCFAKDGDMVEFGQKLFEIKED